MRPQRPARNLIFSTTTRGGARRRRERNTCRANRSGKILVMMAILLPVLCGFAGLVLDSSLLMADFRNLQHASDAAATEAAMTLYNGGNSADATAAAVACIQTENGFADANVQVNIPPSTGPYAGNANYVEVIASEQKTTY